MIPTITSISPNGGSTRGRNQIRIIGTGFSMPPDSPVDVSGAAFQSIKVLFGSLQSDAAYAITETMAIANVPTYIDDEMGELGDAVDITLQNLDNGGGAIVGEEVVFSSYTYNRPLLTDGQVLEYVTTQFVLYLRRHVTKNIWITMGRSFSEEDDQLNGKIKQAKLPMIWINGVDLDNDLLSQPMGNQEFMTDEFNFNEYRPPTTVKISLPRIQIYSNQEHSREIMALSQAFLNAFRDVPHLVCAPPAYDSESSQYRYPMMIPNGGMPSFDLGPENDGLKVCTVSVVIEEVDLTDLSGTLTDIGWTVEENPEIILTAAL